MAARAGVDPSTASRVLSGDPAQHARDETRERILKAAADLGYRPNALARSLRTHRTGTIGLLVPSLASIAFSDVTHGVQVAAAEAGRLLLVVEAEAVPTDDSKVADQVYERLVGDGLVDGLIVAYETLPEHHLARLKEQGIPLVLVNRQIPGVHGSVIVDDLGGTRMAVEYLIGLGHERIGYLGLDLASVTARRRLQGYLEAMVAAGLEARHDLMVAAPRTIEGGREGIDELLEQYHSKRPTAVFVAVNMSALGARAALLDHGLRIPDDVSLMTLLDHPVNEHTAPPLSAVRMPNLEMGEEAVRMLLGAIDGGPVSDIVVDREPELVIRASTGPPPAS